MYSTNTGRVSALFGTWKLWIFCDCAQNCWCSSWAWPESLTCLLWIWNRNISFPFWFAATFPSQVNAPWLCRWFQVFEHWLLSGLPSGCMLDWLAGLCSFPENLFLLLHQFRRTTSLMTRGKNVLTIYHCMLVANGNPEKILPLS